MTRKKQWWLLAAGVTAAAGLLSLAVAAHVLGNRFDPYIREQAILYLEGRFDSEVELSDIRVRLPQMSPLKLLLNRGRGTTARVDGHNLVLRSKVHRNAPPLFVMKAFTFEVDLGTLFEESKRVLRVTIDGLEVNIPPKGERPGTMASGEGMSVPDVLIEEVILTDSVLTILPKDPKKNPLRFDLHRVRLESAGAHVAMKYDAELTNAKPPGEIRSTGTFGPWSADEPGDTPLTGHYEFNNADLGVFSGIKGILHSTGDFEGSLSFIDVEGQASVPDFRLKMSGNSVPLATTFQVRVDGTNGNTILQPVYGRLGTTQFTTSGGVIKHEADRKHTIALDVTMPKGNLRDLLTLAMKGPPFMEGQVFLKTKIDIPPLTGKVREKLELDGQFRILEGKFLRSMIQDKLDSLSRRGQGQPESQEIDQVVSMMHGAFKLTNEVITFSWLSFQVPGANVTLAGDYDLDRDVLDFHGALRLRATVSQTMTGWKRWALKPADPFFAKQGAGTFLRIKVEGSSKEPKFGLDRGPNEAEKKSGVEPGKPTG